MSAAPHNTHLAAQPAGPVEPPGPLEGVNHTSRLALTVPDELVEAVAARAAELVADRLQHAGGPWLTVAEAADHVRGPRSRIYALVSKRAIPFEKDGSRLLFHRDELDAWIRRGGATRP